MRRTLPVTLLGGPHCARYRATSYIEYLPLSQRSHFLWAEIVKYQTCVLVVPVATHPQSPRGLGLRISGSRTSHLLVMQIQMSWQRYEGVRSFLRNKGEAR